MPRYALYEPPWYSSTSPGDSSVPANMPPIITQCAPAASALAMSPEYRIPPSPITGTPVPSNALATRAIALICGTPTPAMTRVVQIDPGPMPTFTASAPCLTRSKAASAVTMLPPITWMSEYFALILETISSTPREWPCEVSTTTTSTPASRNAATLSKVSGEVPTAAPTRSLPTLSLQAFGNSVAF